MKTTKLRVWGVLVGGVAAAAAPVLTPSIAGATNYGSGSPQTAGGVTAELSVANNKWHSYSFHTAPSNWRTALNDAVTNSYSPTSLVTSQKSNGSNNVDVRVDVQDHASAGPIGWVYCPPDGIRNGSDPNESCYRQWLKIDTGQVPAGTDQDGRKAVMCHEFGHTVGLRHTAGTTHPNPDQSCMSSSSFNFDDVAIQPHDVAHINSHY